MHGIVECASAIPFQVPQVPRGAAAACRHFMIVHQRFVTCVSAMRQKVRRLPRGAPVACRHFVMIMYASLLRVPRYAAVAYRPCKMFFAHIVARVSSKPLRVRRLPVGAPVVCRLFVMFMYASPLRVPRGAPLACRPFSMCFARFAACC